MKVIPRDVIQIVDEDILNAIAFTLWGMTHQEVLESNNKEYQDFTQEFVDYFTSGQMEVIHFSIGGIEIASADRAVLLCHRFNNFRYSMYVTDTFLVKEVFEDHFKITFLNDYCRNEYKRLYKFEEMQQIFKELKFPHDWEYSKFFRLGCNFGKKE